MEKNRENISDIRKDYSRHSLDVSDVPDNPMMLFEKWLNEAIEAATLEPTAMTLSTVSAEGRPSARVVLLKGVMDNGFIFYTNYHSRKGRDLFAVPYAALTFFWPELERQVRIEGRAEKVSPALSDAYFNSRPRGSQIGALISPQSSVIESRVFLEQREKKLLQEYEGKEVQRPEHWGGYIISPGLIEFWQGRPSRLHDRVCYNLQENNSWNITRLAP